MPNLPYDNFFLSNEIEDQFNSHLNLQRFATVDNGLVGTAGRKRRYISALGLTRVNARRYV